MLDSAVIPSDVTSLCVIPVLFRERRAARRAALGITEPEQEEPPAPTRTERSRPRADSKTNTNDRSNLEVSSPTNGRQRSPRSSPRPSPGVHPLYPGGDSSMTSHKSRVRFQLGLFRFVGYLHSTASTYDCLSVCAQIRLVAIRERTLFFKKGNSEFCSP